MVMLPWELVTKCKRTILFPRLKEESLIPKDTVKHVGSCVKLEVIEDKGQAVCYSFCILSPPEEVVICTVDN